VSRTSSITGGPITLPSASFFSLRRLSSMGDDYIGHILIQRFLQDGSRFGPRRLRERTMQGDS